MSQIYVASSWRNAYQADVVKLLRYAGLSVYDFRNPPNSSGFSWREVDANWQEWTWKEYVTGLEHPVAIAGYESDFNAMRDALACVLVLPCGRSAHLEAGWFAGQGKPVIVYNPPGVQLEPELMVRMCTLLEDDLNRVTEWLLNHVATVEEAADVR